MFTISLRIFVVCILLTPVLAFSEDLYTWTDENGVMHYSNAPSQLDEKVDVKDMPDTVSTESGFVEGEQVSKENEAEEGDLESPHEKKRRTELQGKSADFPVVIVNTKSKKASFLKLDLSHPCVVVEGKNYFAFRFTTPNQITDLQWAFRKPKDLLAWYIIPVKGRMRGFDHFDEVTYEALLKKCGIDNMPDVSDKDDRFIISSVRLRI